MTLEQYGKIPLSVIIPAKNEERNLSRCLASIEWANEIFLVDSQSIDQSTRVAEHFGAKVHQFQFNGTWPKKKNWALENLPFTHEWVLILDADEVLPPEAEGEIRAIVTDPALPYAGYWINRRFMFMGRWLKHAYFPNWNLRLFKHSLGRYEQLTDADTSSGDNEVHEHVVVRGPTARLESLMDHYAFPSVGVFVEKHNRYSNWEARIAVEGGDRQELQNRSTAWRRKIKRAARRLPCRPFLRFFYVYVIQGGVLDGKEGYYFAMMHGFYEVLTMVKAYELKCDQASSIETNAQYISPNY